MLKVIQRDFIFMKILRSFFDEENSMYEVYENGNSEPDYTFDDPNFNVVQFRSNFVMRWDIFRAQPCSWYGQIMVLTLISRETTILVI